MKLRKDKKEKEPVRLNKKTDKKTSLTKINKNDLQMILLLLILFLILFVLIPLTIYSAGSMESTNYYYRLNDTIGMILPLLI